MKFGVFYIYILVAINSNNGVTFNLSQFPGFRQSFLTEILSILFNFSDVTIPELTEHTLGNK